MYEDLFYFKTDVIETYADKRKALEREDVADLLKCLVKFIQKDSKTKNAYAYRFPYLGVMYRKLEDEMVGKLDKNENKLMYQMLTDIWYNETVNKFEHPLLRVNAVDRVYPSKTKDELQEQQNI